MAAALDNLLMPTEFLDYESEAVRGFVKKALPDAAKMTEREKACALYYAVRDGIRYEIYGADLSRRGLRASFIIERAMGFCVHKAIVYAAAVRAAGIPSRIVYCDVRNHLSSQRLRELVGGDVFRFHSLTSVCVDGAWVKATPVFNLTLCKLYKIRSLDFDGRSDSLYHPYDDNGRLHMELVLMRGEFDDVPYETVVAGLREAHPRLFPSAHLTAAGSLINEAT